MGLVRECSTPNERFSVFSAPEKLENLATEKEAGGLLDGPPSLERHPIFFPSEKSEAKFSNGEVISISPFNIGPEQNFRVLDFSSATFLKPVTLYHLVEKKTQTPMPAFFEERNSLIDRIKSDDSSDTGNKLNELNSTLDNIRWADYQRSTAYQLDLEIRDRTDKLNERLTQIIAGLVNLMKNQDDKENSSDS